MDPSIALTGASSAAAVATAVIASISLRQVRRDSADQSRPYIQIQTVPSISGGHTVDLVIRNMGRTAARDLTFTASRWPTHSDTITEALGKLFDTPRTLAPGAAIRAFWIMDLTEVDPLNGELKNKTQDLKTHPAGLTTPTTLTASYFGELRGRKRRRKGPRYADAYSIDVLALGPVPLGAEGPYTTGNHEKTVVNKLGALTRAVNMLRLDD